MVFSLFFPDLPTFPTAPHGAPRLPALRSSAELWRRVEQQSFASPFGAELKELLLRGGEDLGDMGGFPSMICMALYMMIIDDAQPTSYIYIYMIYWTYIMIMNNIIQ